MPLSSETHRLGSIAEAPPLNSERRGPLCAVGIPDVDCVALICQYFGYEALIFRSDIRLALFQPRVSAREAGRQASALPRRSVQSRFRRRSRYHGWRCAAVL